MLKKLFFRICFVIYCYLLDTDTQQKTKTNKFKILLLFQVWVVYFKLSVLLNIYSTKHTAFRWFFSTTSVVVNTCWMLIISITLNTLIKTYKKCNSWSLNSVTAPLSFFANKFSRIILLDNDEYRLYSILSIEYVDAICMK